MGKRHLLSSESVYSATTIEEDACGWLVEWVGGLLVGWVVDWVVGWVVLRQFNCVAWAGLGLTVFPISISQVVGWPGWTETCVLKV